MLHDLFQYSNVYSLISGHTSIASVLHDDPYSRSIQAQCEAYVSLTSPGVFPLISLDPSLTVIAVTPFATLYQYYVKLQPGLTIQDWIMRDKIDSTSIDIRRMISFGIIKGFLKRIQVFPVWLDHASFANAEDAQRTAAAALLKSRGRTAGTRHEVSSAQKTSLLFGGPIQKERDITPRPGLKVADLGRSGQGDDFNGRGYPASLPALLDGEHSSDEVR